MAVDDSPKYYRVIVSGTLLPGKSRAEVIAALASLFHSREDTVLKLLQGEPVPLAKEYEHDHAVKICRAVRAAGAACEMEEIVAPVAPPPAEPPAQDGFSENEDEGEDEGEKEQAAPAGAESAFMRLVAVNTEYYFRQFAKFGSLERPSFAISWHWPSFFAFFFWAMYRKLWLWAGVNLAGGVVLMFTVAPGFGYLAWALLWPLTANYLYYRHIRRRVLASAAADDGGDGRQVDSGGVSRAAVGFGILLVFLLSVVLNQTISERILEQYIEQAGEFIPGPGSRQRGDGSTIAEDAALTPEVARTVTALKAIAGVLQVAVSDEAQESEKVVQSVFRRIIRQRRVNDAWGTAFELRRDASGQIALISAGPDGVFDNG